jgi:hypothetical protein
MTAAGWDCLHNELSNPCHPERSRVIREANGSAESKDPYLTHVLTAAARYSHDALDRSGRIPWIPPN